MGKFLSSGFDPINEINVLKLQWGLLDALCRRTQGQNCSKLEPSRAVFSDNPSKESQRSGI